jgi:hypothetical protein
MTNAKIVKKGDMTVDDLLKVIECRACSHWGQLNKGSTCSCSDEWSCDLGLDSSPFECDEFSVEIG